MASVSLAALLVREVRSAFYAKGLQVAAALGLPVTSWSPGDPTRSLYHYLAEALETLEGVVALFVASGFLDTATGSWLRLLAKQLFNVDYIAATYATCEVTLSNAKGGQYDVGIHEVVVKNSTTDKLFWNTTTGTIPSGPGSTVTLDFEAQEAGSDSSSAVGEIDEMVTVYPGVTCANGTAAVGLDDEEPESLRERCRDKLGALSPNGPADAYAYVARDTELTGTAGVTRVRTYGESDTGDVLVYIAGPSGAVSTEVRDAVEDAIVEWATPLCITPTVTSATNVTVPVTYELWLYATDGRTVDEIEEAVEEILEQMFARLAIGGDIIPPSEDGFLYTSRLISALRSVSDYAFRVSLVAPAANVALDTAVTKGQVAALGAVTATVNVVNAP
jgi:phage-related baseplate assembly protein